MFIVCITSHGKPDYNYHLLVSNKKSLFAMFKFGKKHTPLWQNHLIVTNLRVKEVSLQMLQNFAAKIFTAAFL